MTDIREAARILDAGTIEGREALARDTATPPEALYFLTGDADPAVRRLVAQNPATPRPAYRILTSDSETGVRVALAARLQEIAPGLPQPQQDRLADMAWSALSQLAADTAEEVRAAVAETVGSLPHAPREMILRLARDTAMAVAEPVIRLSPLLSEEDLLGLVAAPPGAETLTAVARRPGISETVADALLSTGDTVAIGALLGNRTAAIREAALDALVVQAAERTAWQEPLVRRPSLTPRAMIALAGLVAEHLLGPLLNRADMPAGMAAQLRAAVAARLGGAARPGETAADTATRVAMLLEAKALDDASILRAARAGETEFVVAALAGLSGVPRGAIDLAAGTRCAKSIGGLCRRAGLGQGATQAVIALLAPGAPGVAAVAPALLGDGELRWRIDALSRAAAQ